MASERPEEIRNLFKFAAEELVEAEFITDRGHYSRPVCRSLEINTTHAKRVTGGAETVHVTIDTPHHEHLEDHLVHYSHIELEIQLRVPGSTKIVTLYDLYLTNKLGSTINAVAALRVTGGETTEELRENATRTQNSQLMELLCKVEREEDSSLQRFHDSFEDE
jgi:hypothetical protein